MTTLEDLYYGNIVPHEHSFKRGSAYSEVLSYVIRHQVNTAGKVEHHGRTS